MELSVQKGEYRRLDVLMVDDVEFLSGKEGTQTEFPGPSNDVVSTLARGPIRGIARPCARAPLVTDAAPVRR